MLADKGLAAALQSQAGKATLPVHVGADGVECYPQETEAALYFCTLEALQNVQKYAAASAVAVRLRDDEKQLCRPELQPAPRLDTRDDRMRLAPLAGDVGKRG